MSFSISAKEIQGVSITPSNVQVTVSRKFRYGFDRDVASIGPANTLVSKLGGAKLGGALCENPADKHAWANQLAVAEAVKEILADDEYLPFVPNPYELELLYVDQQINYKWLDFPEWIRQQFSFRRNTMRNLVEMVAWS